MQLLERCHQLVATVVELIRRQVGEGEQIAHVDVVVHGRSPKRKWATIPDGRVAREGGLTARLGAGARILTVCFERAQRDK